MASLTGQTIASTYDALLKITDNGPITASLKQITDGLGNNTPLYLSATTVYVNGAFRVSGAFFDSNNEPGTAGQFLVSTGTGVDWQNISESGLISGSGTNGFISKFTAGGVIANSVIQESGSNIGIGISPTQKLHVSGNGLFTGTITASNISGSTSGSNTGDETNASIKTKLGAATAVNDGYLTAVDYELFTNKVPLARTITINGETYDLSANRTYTVDTGVTSFNTRTGAVVLSSSDVTTALGYTPALESRIMTINGVGYSLAADRSWSVGTVTSVGTSAPLTGGTITGAGTIGITQANASTDGYLSSTDWNTFNNKQAALGFTPENAANKGIANGYASLDGAGKVPSTQLPSYVDDVVEVANFAALPATGETGKIYITLDTNFVYRWSGSVYVKISEPNAVWGSITGTLSNQTDLQSALDGKVDDATTLTINGVTSDLSANRTFNVGTVTSVSGTGSVSGLSLSGSVTGSGSLTLGGTLSLTSSDVTTGLGYTPVTNARTLSINGTAFDLTANRSWNVGTVTSVGLELGTTGTDANIANSPITSSGNITLNLPTASASNRGLLSSTDWSTFNAKQNALTLTTTGNSGSATLVGSTLNIPTYTLAGLGGQPLLTNPVTGTGTSGYLTRFTGTTTVGNSVIFDNGSQIGIGTASPAYKLDVNGDLNIAGNTIHRIGGTPFVATSANITYFYNNTSGMQWRNSGDTSTQMALSSTGNVGIGTSSPSTQLHLNGSADIRMSNSANTSGFDIGMLGGNADANAYIYQRANSNMILATNNTERMRITSGGQVAIGESSSVYLSQFTLSYNPASNNGPIILDRRSFASGVGSIQWLGGKFNSAGSYRPFGGIGSFKENGTDGDSSGFLSLWTNSNAADASEKMRITSGGNVGIGTSSPVTKLDVRGDAGTYIRVSSSDNYHVGNLGWDNNGVFLGIGGYGNPSLRFETSGSERMRITSGGDVLIGTTTTGGKLTVSDPNNFFVAGFTGNNSNTLSLGTYISTPAIQGFASGGGNANIVLQPNGGNVRVNNTGNGLNNAKFYVVSDSGGTAAEFNANAVTATLIRFANAQDLGGSITIGGGGATAYNTSSDYRLKEDLREINGLEKVSKLKVYDFKWKNTKERMDGVLAHELQEVIPYAVTGEKDGEQMQGVDYSKLVPILVKAIQEQQAQIEELKAKLK